MSDLFAAAKKAREQVASTSLLKTSPNESEIQLIHKLFLDTVDAKCVKHLKQLDKFNSL